MAFKMKAAGTGPMKKNFPGAFKETEEERTTGKERRKEKHAGGVVGGKTGEGEVSTTVKSVAIKRIKAMNLSPKMEAQAIKELTSSMVG